MKDVKKKKVLGYESKNFIDKVYNKLYKNTDWSFRNNRIYFNKYVDQEILKYDSDCLYITMNLPLFKPISKLLLLMNEDDLNNLIFISPVVNNKIKSIEENEFHFHNIRNYIYCFSDEKLFDFMFKNNIDMVLLLVNYFRRYDCYDIFIETFKMCKKDLEKETWSYSTNWPYGKKCSKFGKRDDIQQEILGLERSVKIYLLT